jgi:beta-N-acetylhexosaminidase
MIESSSLPRQVGQLMVIGFEGTEVNERVRSRLADIRPAGVVLFARNLQNPEQIRRLTADLQSTAQDLGIAPLLIAVDHEGGAVVRMGPPVTAFPGNLALGAAGDANLAGRQACAMAEELLALGFNWNLAPCMDVNSNPRNPIIGVRSFGDDPKQVAEFGAAMIDGFQSRGLLACAKHFPGHGDTEVDSHIGLPYVSRPLESIREIELVPFQTAIKAGVASIMTAHVIFSALEPKRPATVSPRIITGLLREEMGFDGVVVSDALEMAGIADSVGVADAVVDCINAGVDLLLTCNDETVQDEALAALQRSLDNGQIDSGRLQRTFRRVSRMKQAFIQENAAVPLERVGCDEHQRLEGEIAAGSITLLKDEQGLLPIKGAEVLISSIGADEAALAPLKQALAEKCKLTNDGKPNTVNLMVTRDLHRQPQLLAEAQRTAQQSPRTILLMAGYPGDSNLIPGVGTVIACCGIRPVSLRAAAKVLLGEAMAPGCLPLKT